MPGRNCYPGWEDKYAQRFLSELVVDVRSRDGADQLESGRGSWHRAGARYKWLNKSVNPTSALFPPQC